MVGEGAVIELLLALILHTAGQNIGHIPDQLRTVQAAAGLHAHGPCYVEEDGSGKCHGIVLPAYRDGGAS